MPELIYDGQRGLLLVPEVMPPQPVVHGHIYTYDTPARAQEVAEQLTAQNRAGRQAKGCAKRRFSAIGTQLHAHPMEG